MAKSPGRLSIVLSLFTAFVLLLWSCNSTAEPTPTTPTQEPTPASTRAQTPTTAPTPARVPELEPELTAESQPEEVYYIRYRGSEPEKYILPTFEELAREKDGIARNYPRTVKGVWEPDASIGNRLIRKRLPELKDLGVNTFHVLPHYDYINDELVLISVRIGSTSLTGEKAEREYIDRVVKAKNAGFAVSIMPSYFDHEAKAIPDLEAFDEFALHQARKWAQIAEEYQVEYFSPISEYEKHMSAQGLSQDALVERVNSWNREVLAAVNTVFTGKIILKVSQLGLGSYSAQSASGYDIFAIALGMVGGELRLGEFRMSVHRGFNEAQEVAERDDVEWMVGEFFLHTGVRSEEECVEIFRLVFEAYKKALDDERKPVGFTFFGWEMPVGKIRDTEIVPSLKQFFHDIDSAGQEATG